MTDVEEIQPQFLGHAKLLEVYDDAKHKMRDNMLRAGVNFDPLTNRLYENEFGLSFQNEGEPWSGFYRVERDGRLVPVAIWRDGRVLFCAVGGLSEPWQNIWPDCGWKPVTYEWYDLVTDKKQPWPDEGVPEKLRGIGDNRPPEATESSVLQGEIAEARAGLKNYATITDDAQAAAAQSLRSLLLELARKGDKLRVKLKAPHLEAGRKIDAEWGPIIKNAEAGANQIAAAMNAWENTKLKREQEEQAARDAAAEAAAEEAEAAAHKARLEGTEPPLPPLPPAEVPPIAPTTTIKGATGRAAHVSTVKVIDSVFDWIALFNYVRDDPEVTALLLAKANRLLKLNPLTQIPGVKIKDERRVA